MRSFKKVIIGGLLSVFMLSASPAVPLFAQSTFASVTGSVTDSSGAMIPGAKVTLTETQTNVIQKTVTDTHGIYQFLNLLPGVYVVNIDKEGFHQFKTDSFNLVARQKQRVDAALALAKRTQSVEVVSRPPTINTENSNVSYSTSHTDLINAPLNYRTINTSPLQALYAQPEVIESLAGPDGRTSRNYSIEGASWNWTDATVDGIYVGSARRSGTNLDTFPSTESVSELRVHAIGNNAEYAQVADISMVTRSGTNRYHGSLFYNYNGNSLNANPAVYYNIAHPSLPSRLVNNDYGGSIGGPIRKDKTFFFADFESLTIHGNSSHNARVIPVAFRNGDFSSLLSGPNPIQLTDPYTGTPYQGNIITDPINPVTSVLLNKYFPAPNSGSDQYVFAGPSTADSYQYDARVDHNISQRQRLFVRWSQKFLTPSSPVSFPAFGNSTIENRPEGIAVSYNFTFTPTILNEFRFGWQQSNQLVKPIAIDHTQALNDLNLNLTATSFPAGVGFPHVFIDPYSSIDYKREEDLKEHNMQYSDDLTWVHGRHELKFGGSILHFRVHEQATFNGADGLGQFWFQDFIPSAQDPTLNGSAGYSIANFYLGLPTQVDQDSAGPDWEGVARQYGIYGQDSWKATRRLTINIGLRYNYMPPFHDVNGNISNFDPYSKNGDVWVPNQASLDMAAPTFVLALHDAKLLTAQQAGVPESLRYSDKTDINPRFGFAFLPFAGSTRTVIRGGYGIYTVRVLGAIFNSMTAIHTSSAVTYYPTVDTVSHSPSTVWPNTTTGSPDFSVPPLQSFGTAVNPHYHDPYTQQWSLTAEHEFTPAFSLRLSYTGQHAIGLTTAANLNQIPFNTTGAGASGPPANRPFLSWDRVHSRENGGVAEYKDFSTQLRINTANVHLNSTYVLASALTNAGGPNGTWNFLSEIGNDSSSRFDARIDWGPQREIPRHRWVTTFDFVSPFGRSQSFGQHLSPVLQMVAGSWRLFTITTLSSGMFLTPYSHWNPSGIESPPVTRGDMVPGQDPNAGPHTLTEWFNTAAFTTDAFHNGPNPVYLGRIGNAPEGNANGPGWFDLDLALRRDFKVHERYTLGMYVQSKNILNHPILSIPGTYIDSSTFGKIYGIRPNSTRTVIIGARLEF